jgi:hypothetical protein
VAKRQVQASPPTIRFSGMKASLASQREQGSQHHFQANKIIYLFISLIFISGNTETLDHGSRMVINQSRITTA